MLSVHRVRCLQLVRDRNTEQENTQSREYTTYKKGRKSAKKYGDQKNYFWPPFIFFSMLELPTATLEAAEVSP